MKKQSGFTLVELVIVVVILGFLAVTAIPKFLDLTDQAKEANIEGMAGGFATGVSLVRAQWEAEGRPQNSDDINTVNYDGSTVMMTTESNDRRPGYVVGVKNITNETADSAATLAGGFNDLACAVIWQNILQQPPSITSTFNDLNSDNGIDYFAQEDNNQCIYYLKDTLQRDGDNDFINPSNVTTVGNNFVYTPADGQVVVNINVN